MPIIYVDGDACPVRREAEKVSTRHSLNLVIVCNGGLRPSDNPLVRVVYVDQGLDVADRWILNACTKGDVVITADIPLAADCIAKGAQVLQPNGELLSERNIGNVLATRNLMTDLRGATPLGEGGNGQPFGRADRSRFTESLERLLRNM